jgi:hypothetical protein
MVHATLFMFGRDNNQRQIVFPVLKIDYKGKEAKLEEEHTAATGLLLKIYSSYKFSFLPKPTLLLSIDHDTKTILGKLKWNVSHVVDLDLELSTYLNVPVTLFSEGRWEFGASRVELDYPK